MDTRRSELLAYQVQHELLRIRAQRRRWNYWTPVFAAGLLCLFLFNVVIGIEVVSGASMSPALFSGDIVIYERFGFGIQPGDMVIVRGGVQVDMIKRVVGVAGDDLTVEPDGHITRNGHAVYEPAVWYGWQDSTGWVPLPYTVPENSYFCMGDNRGISLDSRSTVIGAIAWENIKGRILLTIRRQ